MVDPMASFNSPKLYAKTVTMGCTVPCGGRPQRIDPVANAMFRLSKGSVAAYKKRLDGTGKENLVRDSMYVHVYRSSKSASLDHLGWQLRQARQVPIELIDKAALKEIEPEIADQYRLLYLSNSRDEQVTPLASALHWLKKLWLKGLPSPNEGARLTPIRERAADW